MKFLSKNALALIFSLVIASTPILARANTVTTTTNAPTRSTTVTTPNRNATVTTNPTTQTRSTTVTTNPNNYAGLAGLIAVDRATNPYYGGRYGGYMASPYYGGYGGYMASPYYGGYYSSPVTYNRYVATPVPVYNNYVSTQVPVYRSYVATPYAPVPVSYGYGGYDPLGRLIVLNGLFNR